MEYLSRLFVQKPLSALGVSTMLCAAWLGLLFLRKSRVKGLLIAGLAWLAYAVWEWRVLSVTPEANIRIDLLIIVPLLAILTLWGIWKSLRISFRA
jgi:hypothetical protein